jgi:hypothetical protein
MDASIPIARTAPPLEARVAGGERWDVTPWYVRVVEVSHYVLGAFLLVPAIGFLITLVFMFALGSGLSPVPAAGPVTSGAPVGVRAALVQGVGVVAAGVAGSACIYSARCMGLRVRRRFSVAWAVVLCCAVFPLPLGLGTLVALSRRRVVALYGVEEVPWKRHRSGPTGPWYLTVLEDAHYGVGVAVMALGSLYLLLPVGWLLRELANASVPMPRGAWLAQLVAGFGVVALGAMTFRSGRWVGRRVRRGSSMAWAGVLCLTGFGAPLAVATWVCLTRLAARAAYRARQDGVPGFDVFARDSMKGWVQKSGSSIPCPPPVRR